MMIGKAYGTDLQAILDVAEAIITQVHKELRSE
jgi:hypothetical protein